MHELANSNSAY